MNGRRSVVTVAVLVAGVRMWQQIRGNTKTPFGEWAVGWGVVFFFLAMLSEVSDDAASGLAWAIFVGDLLVNGASLFEDVSGVVTGAETSSGGTILTPTPFTAGTADEVSSPPAGSRGTVQTGKAA